ncbi:hypothetical protein [Bacillus tuaregi]|uniref:hypothetical protein n=1 Tax=Bacillus tuaregi TaxID=1816695 RepID=UPI0008F810FE|nr:hypothetical protein [Bacillus tuaregi]
MKVMGKNNDQDELKQLYEETFRELQAYLEEGKVWKDYSVEEFKEEVKKFWERSDVWKKAWEMKIFSEEKLDRDFEIIRMNAKLLLLD